MPKQHYITLHCEKFFSQHFQLVNKAFVQETNLLVSLRMSPDVSGVISCVIVQLANLDIGFDCHRYIMNIDYKISSNNRWVNLTYITFFAETKFLLQLLYSSQSFYRAARIARRPQQNQSDGKPLPVGALLQGDIRS